MNERYIFWLTKYLFITECRFDAIWVLSWVTKIQIRTILNVYAVCAPTPATWRSATVARCVTREENGAFFPLKSDCKYWTNELKLSWPRKANYSFHQADSWCFANIFCVRADCWVVRFLEERRANT